MEEKRDSVKSKEKTPFLGNLEEVKRIQKRIVEHLVDDCSLATETRLVDTILALCLILVKLCIIGGCSKPHILAKISETWERCESDQKEE